MKEAIESAQKQIDLLYEQVRNLKEFIAAAQKICDHDWVDAPEHYDYHRREDYVKCSICGVVR